MSSPTPSPSLTRVPLRLRLADAPGPRKLDGGWWPQSRDLATELADLVDHVPAPLRVSRAVFSPPDWDDHPRRVPVDGRYVKVGSFPHDDTHLLLLTLSDATVLRLLVVPPTQDETQAEEALRQSSDADAPSRTASEVLTAVAT